jgi:protein-serine/threonine kinase
MKVPLLLSSDDPTAIVAFEVEQMIMPKLKGIHVPRFLAPVTLMRNRIS